MRDLAFVPTAKKTLLCDRRNPGGRFGPLRYIGPPTSIVTFNTSQGFAGIYVPPHGRRNDLQRYGSLLRVPLFGYGAVHLAARMPRQRAGRASDTWR